MSTTSNVAMTMETVTSCGVALASIMVSLTRLVDAIFGTCFNKVVIQNDSSNDRNNHNNFLKGVDHQIKIYQTILVSSDKHRGKHPSCFVSDASIFYFFVPGDIWCDYKAKRNIMFLNTAK